MKEKTENRLLHKFYKGFVVIILFLALSFSFICFLGCDIDDILNGLNPDTNKEQVDDKSGDNTDDETEDGLSDEAGGATGGGQSYNPISDNTKKRIEDFIISLSSGYIASMGIYENGHYINVKYHIHNGLISIFKNDEHFGYYYTDENGIAYDLIFYDEDERWHRIESKMTDINYLLLSTLNSTDWKKEDDDYAYGFNTKGKNDSYLLFHGDEVKFFNESSSFRLCVIYNIGNTTVVLPDLSDVIDGEEIYIPPLTPIEETDLVYRFTKNGYEYNYEFDITKLKKLIEEWLSIEGNLDTAISASSGNLFERIVFLDPIVLNKSEMGIIYISSDGQRYYNGFYLEPDWIPSTYIPSTVTTQDFADFLNTHSRPIRRDVNYKYEIDYTTLDYSEEQKAEFDILSANCLNVLSYDLSDENAKIIFGFMTIIPDSLIYYHDYEIELYVGPYRTWHQFYLIERGDGQLEYIIIEVSSLIDDKETEPEYGKINVLNDDKENYKVSYKRYVEIDNTNLSFYCLNEDLIESTSDL